MVEVVHFLWVIYKVEQFPLVFSNHAGIVNQLMGIRAYPDHFRQSGSMLVKMIVRFVAHFFRFAFENTTQRVSLDITGNRKFGIIQQGGGKVDMIDHRLVYLLGANFSREADEQGLVKGILVHPLLVVEPVLA